MPAPVPGRTSTVCGAGPPATSWITVVSSAPSPDVTGMPSGMPVSTFSKAQSIQPRSNEPAGTGGDHSTGGRYLT